MLRYRYQPDGSVVEEGHNRRIMQRPWSEGFARRVLAAANGASLSRPDVPDWRLLRPDADMPKEVGDLRWFLIDVPWRVRRLAGHLPRHQWLALEAMRHVAGFDDFLEQEIGAAGVGFVLACWELAETPRRAQCDRLALARAMMAEPRAALLSRLADVPFEAPQVRACARLPVSQVQADVIWELRDLMADSEGVRAVEALPLLDARTLRALRALPRWLLRPPVIRAVAYGGNEEAVRRALSERVAGAAEVDRRRILQSLRTVANWSELAARLVLWDARLRSEEALPEPPIPGDALLQPLASVAALAREAHEMRHCVAGYESEIRAGRCYVYSWRGDERATVQLALRNGNWELTQALGVANARLRQTTLNRICAVVRAQLPVRRRIVDSYVAGLAFYDAARLAGSLTEGQQLVLRRQPSNAQDRAAIEILTKDGLKLGYVPRGVNRSPSGLLDAGHPVDATILGWGEGGAVLHIRLAWDVLSVAA